jgi:hypothetical protein
VPALRWLPYFSSRSSATSLTHGNAFAAHNAALVLAFVLAATGMYYLVRRLAAFPNRDGFKILEANHVRYAMFHMYGYNGENRHEILGRLADFHAYLRPVFANETTQLYEITGFPR